MVARRGRSTGSRRTRARNRSRERRGEDVVAFQRWGCERCRIHMWRSLLMALLAASTPSCVVRTPEPVPARVGYPSYDGHVDIDPVARHVSARWRIAYVRTPATMDSATLLLNK